MAVLLCAVLGFSLARVFPFPFQTMAGPSVDAPVSTGTVVELPGVGQVTWGAHAFEKHGDDASFAIRAAQACGEQCLYRCKSDDKWYLIGRIGERFFTVVGYGTRGATAFISGDDPTRRVLQEGCESVRARWAGHDGFTPGLGY